MIGAPCTCHAGSESQGPIGCIIYNQNNHPTLCLLNLRRSTKMATPRLTFLYPFLFAPARSAIKQNATRSARRGFRTASRKGQVTLTQRYGSANEPPPHLADTKNIAPPPRPKDAASKDAKALPKPTTRTRKTKTDKEQPPLQAPITAEAQLKQEEPVVDKDATTQSPKQEEVAPSPSGELSPPSTPDDMDTPPVYAAPPSPKLPSKNPLETVLNMPASDDLGTAQAPVYYHENASTNPEEHRPPHISTPPYVHHFDTFGLVKRLEEGGWTDEQAVTIMKAVRLVLAENMDLAREGLVSKSNVENETYLFRAACSELRTEIQTKRKGEVEKSRTERAQLQHEVDILGQRLTQEGGNLKDELKGMFDDRKMAVRNEQRSMESKVCSRNESTLSSKVI